MVLALSLDQRGITLGLLDLLQQLHKVLGFEYSRRIGGLPNDTA
jgi:hypothetical protein